MTRTLLVFLFLSLLSTGEVFAQSAAAVAPSSRSVVESQQFVLLRNGETVVGQVSLNGNAGSVDANGTRYDFADVASFASDEGEFAVMRASGSRYQLLEKTAHGRFQTFRPTGAGGLEYYQIGDGPLRPITTADLRQHFAGHETAMHHMNRERFYGNVGLGAMVAGGALVATGAVLEFGNVEGGPSGIAIAGSGVLFAVAVNGLVPVLQRGARNNAIRAYNQ